MRRLLFSFVGLQFVKRQLATIAGYITIRCSQKQKFMSCFNPYRTFVGLYFLVFVLLMYIYVIACVSEREQIKRDLIGMFKTSLLHKIGEQSKSWNENVGTIRMGVDTRYSGRTV